MLSCHEKRDISGRTQKIGIHDLATKHLQSVILSNAKNLAFSVCCESLSASADPLGEDTKPVLSISTRFFTSFRMTGEGLRMTKRRAQDDHSKCAFLKIDTLRRMK
jgi:hypothetical protein